MHWRYCSLALSRQFCLSSKQKKGKTISIISSKLYHLVAFDVCIYAPSTHMEANKNQFFSLFFIKITNKLTCSFLHIRLHARQYRGPLSSSSSISVKKFYTSTHFTNGLLADGKSTMVQVMTWWRQATSHYLSQCWSRSMSPYGVTRPQRVEINQYLCGTTI